MLMSGSRLKKVYNHDNDQHDYDGHDYNISLVHFEKKYFTLIIYVSFLKNSTFPLESIFKNVKQKKNHFEKIELTGVYEIGQSYINVLVFCTSLEI